MTSLNIVKHWEVYFTNYESVVHSVIYPNILDDGILFIVDFFSGQGKGSCYAYLELFLKTAIVSGSLLMEAISKLISKVANELIDKLPQSEFVIADKGYDSESIRKM